MVKLYFRGGCYSSTKAMNWLKEYDIQVKMLHMNQISQKDLLQLLLQSENGFDDFLKNKMQMSSEMREKIDIFEQLSFNTAIAYILLNPDLLRTPIILAKNKYFVGYNRDELRQFISKEYRKCNLELKKNLIIL